MGIAPPRTLSSAEQEGDCGCDRREGGEEGEKLIKVRRELMGDTSCARGSCGVLGWRSTIRTGFLFDFLELFVVHADRDSREWIWWLIGEWLAFHFHGLLLV